MRLNVLPMIKKILCSNTNHYLPWYLTLFSSNLIIDHFKLSNSSVRTNVIINFHHIRYLILSLIIQFNNKFFFSLVVTIISPLLLRSHNFNTFFIF